jgi:predicted Zn-dependent peptidase
LPEQQNRAVDLLADILRPSLRENDFNTEKKVILEEIQMYNDQPPFGADDKCRTLFYGSHPLGQSVLGTPETVGTLTADAMLDYFQRRYSPSNIVLAAAGRVHFDALVATAERCCGGWEFKPTERRLDPAVGQSGFHVLHRDSATQQYVMQLATGPSATDDDRYAAKLLATVLGDDSGSRLYWDLIDPGLAEQVSLGHSEHDGAGLMMTYLCCEPERTTENLQRILAIYREAETSGITPAELEQAKNKVRSRIVLSAERPRGRLFAIGSDWMYRHEYLTIESELETIAQITVDDLAAVLKKYPLSRSTTVAIGPITELSPPT